MKNVIFLDLDGPVFPSKIFMFEENRDPLNAIHCKKLGLHPFYDYWKADPYAVCAINKFIDIYNVEIVLSTSWADPQLNSKDVLINLFEANGLTINFHKRWRTPRDKFKQRELQIHQWLQEEPSEVNYVILDDIQSGEGLVNPDPALKLKNIFLIDPVEGLKYQEYLDILKKFQ